MSELSLRRLKGVRMGALDLWTVGGLLAAFAVSAPLFAVIYLSMVPDQSDSHGLWSHLFQTVLPGYVGTTLALMVGVGLGTFVIGTGTAWLVAQCRFPGRRIMEWALLLPLAVPAYVLAYVYTDFLEYAGPLQTLLRELFGWSNPRQYWFPEIRSLGGAIAMMTLVLYPYVYLLARAAFQEQSECLVDASRSLGLSPWQSFLRVALPMARPAIVVGLALVLMETLNDFGTVDFFAVQTFTAGIYDVWLNMSSVRGAAQLALVLLVFVFVLLTLERWARRNQRYHSLTTRRRTTVGYTLRGARAWLALLACVLPIGLGFVFPAVVLGRYALDHYQATLDHGYLTIVGNSLTLSFLGAGVAVLIGLFLAYGVRLSQSPWLRVSTRVASVGYAVPGAVLAVGVMYPLANIDNAVDGFMYETFALSTGLLLSGTIVAVTYGYVVRFLALSMGTMEAGLGRIKPNMDGAARTLGLSPGQVLSRIHFPLMRGSILTAVLLVFVDCMKELPMTVLLRPFNYDTLATYVHQYASDELLEESAFAALSIVAVGVLPVVLLSRAIGKSRELGDG
ncbi:MAG: ABC transporter permease [Gammaproteobacteria bacterium]